MACGRMGRTKEGNCASYNYCSVKNMLKLLAFKRPLSELLLDAE